MFDGASNIQKAGEIMRHYGPSAQVENGAEHLVSLIVKKFIMLPCFRESRPDSWNLTFL